MLDAKGVVQAVVLAGLFSTLFLFSTRLSIDGFQHYAVQIKLDSFPGSIPCVSTIPSRVANLTCERDMAKIEAHAAKEKFVTVEEAIATTPCCMSDSAQRPVTLDDVLVVVVASMATLARTHTVKDTWGKDFPHIIYVAEVNDPSVPFVTAPSIEGLGDYGDSGRRQLAYLQHMRTLNDPLLEKPYVFFADDDTFINADALLKLVSRMNPACPIYIGHVFSSQWIAGLDYQSGGAGFLSTRECVDRVLPHVFSNKCPYTGYGDHFFAKCAWREKCQLLHSSEFHFMKPPTVRDANDYDWPVVADAVTFHYVTDAQARAAYGYLQERKSFIDRFLHDHVEDTKDV